MTFHNSSSLTSSFPIPARVVSGPDASRYGARSKSFRTESLRACANPGTMRFPDLRQKRERKGPIATCKRSNWRMVALGTIGWCQRPQRIDTMIADAMP